jgi:hypothetical protein
VLFNVSTSGQQFNVKEGVSCSFDSSAVLIANGIAAKTQAGDHIPVKGKCNGNDLIMGVVLTRFILDESAKWVSKLQLQTYFSFEEIDCFINAIALSITLSIAVPN